MTRSLPSGVPADEIYATHNIPAITLDEFNLFRELILAETGICLRESKRALVVARMASRLRALSLTDYSSYYRHLTEHDQNREELRQMINCITTNKTSFFREPYHFEFLRDEIIPLLKQQAVAAGRPPQLRIWSAACSTGEEPYSIAVTLREALGAAWTGWDVRILASDIDTDVLAKASAAVYPATAADDVPEQYQSKLFLRGTGKYSGSLQIRPEIRAAITFRRINFVDPEWPIHTHFDAIFCRNVMIYFDAPTQKALVGRLLSYIKPQGYFFAGHSENLLWLSERLTSLKNTVYRLKGSGPPAGIPHP